MHGLDEYDFHARGYYPAIMRTTTIDPHAERYYETSPYAWCGNNPLRYVDPDGRDILIWYKDDEDKWQTWSFTGSNHGKAPKNQFVSNFLTAYDYNIGNGGGDNLRNAAESTDFTVNLIKTPIESRRRNLDTGRPQEESFVLWNPEIGLETKEGYSMSPATVLEHEMDHGIRYVTDNTRGYLNDVKQGSDSQYGTREERRVITGSEVKTARANGEFPKNYVRKDHNSSRFIFVPSPTSNKKIKYLYP